MIRSLIVLFCLIGFAAHSTAIDYTVTTTTVGTMATGELDDVITIAISDANAGNDVTVYFDASGLIQITTSLPYITITAGSITFDKLLTASSPQGIQFAGTASDPTFLYGFAVIDNDAPSSVTFKNLTVSDFLDYFSSPTFIPREGIRLGGTKNVEIDHCTFENNSVSVVLMTASNFKFTYNSVKYAGNNFLGLYYDNTGGLPIQPNVVEIKNNIFGDLSSAVAGNGLTLINMIDLDETTLNVENNQFKNLSIGLACSNQHFLYYSPTTDPLFTFNIKDNNFDNIHDGMILSSPLRHWKVEDNDFVNTPTTSDREFDIWLDNSMGGEICGLDFIETSNPFAFTPVNTGNTFSNTTVEAIHIQEDFEAGINIAGLDLGVGCGRIGYHHGKYAIIRGNKIRDTQPISLNYGVGNGGILAPTISSSSLSGGNLNAEISLPGSISSDIVSFIDFYKSNSSGHLLDFIGTYGVFSISGTYSAAVTPLMGVILSDGDRIACTVTSMGNAGGVPRGTSEVVYFTLPPPPCCYPDFPQYAGSGFVKCPPPIPPDPDKADAVYGTLCLGTQFSFNMSGYTCSTGTLTYDWDFGDGYTTTGSLASHTYASVGTYTLTITYDNPSAPDCYGEDVATKEFIITVVESCCPSVTSGIIVDDNDSPEGKHCLGNQLVFNLTKTSSCLFNGHLGEVHWTFSDGHTATGDDIEYTFATTGVYTIQASLTLPGCSPYTYTLSVTIEECFEITCLDCIPTFAPDAGKYVFSVWVREDVPAAVTTYDHKIEASVTTDCSTCSPNTSTTTFIPVAASPIIDGWQKVEGTFVVPVGTNSVKVTLDNRSENDVYFDDIRIHPFNSTSKTYVYDPITLRLSAELDENNYATFYEYDEEGALVRVKKETERGIKTIKEARNNIQKK
jgi:hypothetical protein